MHPSHKVFLVLLCLAAASASSAGERYFQVFTLVGDRLALSGYMEEFFLCTDLNFCLYQDSYSQDSNKCLEEVAGVSVERGVRAIERFNTHRPNTSSHHPIDAILIHCMDMGPVDQGCVSEHENRNDIASLDYFLWTEDECREKYSAGPGKLIHRSGKSETLPRKKVSHVINIYYQ